MRLRYFFDPGSGMCLWAGDDEARKAYGYPIELSKLPLSSETILVGYKLIDYFDSSIDWQDPGGPSPWEEDQRVEFLKEARLFCLTLSNELGQRFEIVDESR